MVGEGARPQERPRLLRLRRGRRTARSDPDLGIAAPTLDPAELAKIDPAAPEIVPRLVAQIANEAAFALEEEVGSPEDMNTAMRLGFNWPLGPLELTELIGAARAVELLEELRERHGEAYRPAPLSAAYPQWQRLGACRPPRPWPQHPKSGRARRHSPSATEPMFRIASTTRQMIAEQDRRLDA